MPTRNPIYDRPWRRAGVVRYAAARVRAILRPPVTVSAAPPDLVVDRDVSVRMRDGVVLRVNVYRPSGSGPFPVILAAHPYGKDRLPKRRWWGWGINPQFRILRQPARWRSRARPAGRRPIRSGGWPMAMPLSTPTSAAPGHPMAPGR